MKLCSFFNNNSSSNNWKHFHYFDPRNNRKFGNYDFYRNVCNNFNICNFEHSSEEQFIR